jgi:hypothetical protein
LACKTTVGGMTMSRTEQGARRAETTVVARYLNALKAPKPRRSKDALLKRRAEVEARLSAGDAPVIEHLKLVQQRMDIDDAIASLEGTEQITELKEAFVKVAGGWCERAGISVAALREVGVSADVLKRAGL